MAQMQLFQPPEETELRALTVRQPWAWAIAAGHKRVENRTWDTKFRGLLAIHAGGSRLDLDDPDARRVFRDVLNLDTRYMSGRTVYGAIVAVARLRDVRLLAAVPDDELTPWHFGPYCWELADVLAIEPLAMGGRLGLFTLTPAVQQEIELRRQQALGRQRPQEATP